MKKIVPLILGLILVMSSFSVVCADTDVGIASSYETGTDYYLPMEYGNQLFRMDEVDDLSPFDGIKPKLTTTTEANGTRCSAKTVDGYIEDETGSETKMAQEGAPSYWWNMKNSNNKNITPTVTFKNLALYHPDEKKWALYDLTVTAEPNDAKLAKGYSRNYKLIGIGYSKAFPDLKFYGYNGVNFHLVFSKAKSYESLPADVQKQLTTKTVKTNLTYSDIDNGQRIAFYGTSTPNAYSWKTKAASDSLAMAKSSNSKLVSRKNSNNWYYFEQKTPSSESGGVKVAGGIAIGDGDFRIFTRSNHVGNVETDASSGRKGSFTAISATSTSMFEKEPNCPYETVDGKTEREKSYKEVMKDGFIFGTTQVKTTKYPSNSGINSAKATTVFPEKTDPSGKVTKAFPLKKNTETVEIVNRIKYYDDLKKSAGLDEIITVDDWKKALETDKKITVNIDTKRVSYTENASFEASTKLHSDWQKNQESRFITNDVIARTYLPWTDIDLDVISYRAIANTYINASGKITVNNEINIKDVTFWLDSEEEPDGTGEIKLKVDGSQCIHSQKVEGIPSENPQYTVCEFKTLEGATPKKDIEDNESHTPTLETKSPKGQHNLYMKVRFDIPSSPDNDTTEVIVKKPLVVTDDERAATIEAESPFIIGDTIKTTGTVTRPANQEVKEVNFYMSYDTIDKDGKTVKQTKALANSDIEGTEDNPVKTDMNSVEWVAVGPDNKYRHAEIECEIPTDVNTDEGRHRVFMTVLYEGEKEPAPYDTTSVAEKSQPPLKNEIIRFVNEKHKDTLKAKKFHEESTFLTEFNNGLSTTVDTVVDSIINKVVDIIDSQKERKE